MKKLPVRLENAITKLYNAFHNDELDAFSCVSCAVGNITGSMNWAMCASEGIEEGLVNIMPSEIFNYPKSKDYSGKELFEVEKIFLGEWAKEKSKNGKNKEIQFKGLCAVIEYLCELDEVDNVMEIQSLFEYKEGVKELNEVIQ